jgi:hypothetical protein
MGNGVPAAEVIEQRGERREAMPDRAAAESAPNQVIAPSNDVGTRHRTELLGPGDACKAHEVADRVLVGAPSAGVAEIGEPLDLGWYVGEPVELGSGEQPAGGQDLDRKLGGRHASPPLPITFS